MGMLVADAAWAELRSMITIGVIRNGGTYLSQHLRMNDYWAEGEKQVQGQWIGRAAEMLGLAGKVEDRPFDDLRENRDWRTGKRLTARMNVKSRMALFDIQISAPKDVSVLAIVGGDERVSEAFVDSVRTALVEMEQYAAVRERRGEARDTEAYRLTGNFVGAMFAHNASRDLDPQLHVHAVLANVTWDPERSRWMALQHAEMMRASPYLRQAFYRDLAGRLHGLGYEPYGMNPTGFSVRGVEHLRERYSKRTREVQELTRKFEQEIGRKATKREVEVLVRESRPKKLLEVTTGEVRANQRAELDGAELRALVSLVEQARTRVIVQEVVSQGEAMNVLEAAIRHVHERKSVVREGEVLGAALELHPDFTDWRSLREALESHPDVIRNHGEMTLRSIREEEARTIRRVREGRNTRMRMGDPARIAERLTRGQKRAAGEILSAKDFLTVLVGDAGSGKTSLLVEVEKTHRASGGEPFLALAPTTRARDGLAESGFVEADTVQRLLVSDALQARAARRVVLVDEAGLLSTHQLERLTAIASARQARLLLVGDTKQHYSVQRGDALRNIVERTHTPVVRLSEVLRQREEPDRKLSRLLAAGDVAEAFLYAERRGLVCDAGGDEALFVEAAAQYAKNLAEGRETLVVIPLWDEIDRFTAHARAAMRRAGLLGEAEVEREAVKPLAWTEEQKAHWGQYTPGDRLLFVRDTRSFRRGTAVEVIATADDGLWVGGGEGPPVKITRKQAGAFDVGRAETLALAIGDRVLIRGRHEGHGFANGDLKQVGRVEPATGEVVFTDGRILPHDFQAWTHGHAMTAYRSQGTTAEESILVLGENAARTLSHRQFYVANTRYRTRHRIFVSNRNQVLERLAERDPGRELAGEFIERHRLSQAEFVSRHRLTRVMETVRMAMWAAADEWQRLKESIRERMEL